LIIYLFLNFAQGLRIGIKQGPIGLSMNHSFLIKKTSQLLMMFGFQLNENYGV
jgi:hypothetical protein